MPAGSRAEWAPNRLVARSSWTDNMQDLRQIPPIRNGIGAESWGAPAPQTGLGGFCHPPPPQMRGAWGAAAPQPGGSGERDPPQGQILYFSFLPSLEFIARAHFRCFM